MSHMATESHRTPEWQAALDAVRSTVNIDGPLEEIQDGLERDFLARGHNLTLVGDAMMRCAAMNGITYNMVGGRGVYAGSLAAVISSDTVRWFAVREARKTHGTQGMIEGARPSKQDSVLLVDALA